MNDSAMIVSVVIERRDRRRLEQLLRPPLQSDQRPPDVGTDDRADAADAEAPAEAR